MTSYAVRKKKLITDSGNLCHVWLIRLHMPTFKKVALGYRQKANDLLVCEFAGFESVLHHCSRLHYPNIPSTYAVLS